MPNASAKSIAVLGAGLTGLTAAYRLARLGHRVRVFEASDRVGGAIRTELSEGWLVEAGPNTILAGEPALSALVAELGLAPERVAANPSAKKRYIVRRGAPLALPLSPPAFLASSQFSLGTKLRVLRDFFARPPAHATDPSIDTFIRHRFGPEIADYVLNPFVTGIYAGDPEKLSARHAFPKLWAAAQSHGSLLRAQQASAKSRSADAGIFSFRRGLQTLPEALAARLPERVLSLRSKVESLTPGAAWTLAWRDGTDPRTETFDAVIAALPAPALAALRFNSAAPSPLAVLDTITHPPVASLFLGYRQDQIAHPLDGFGLLVPAVEKHSFLGVLFSSTLFPGRAPVGHVALTVLAGGMRQPELARLSAGALLARVAPDLEKLLGVRGAPVFQRHTFWPRAIPQYDLGYECHLAAIAATERAHSGFFLGGQAVDGIALPACIAAGERLAARAVA